MKSFIKSKVSPSEASVQYVNSEPAATNRSLTFTEGRECMVHTD